ncbi:hypothetical protein [uncultured Bradyrhizobium sp.]|uniref:hypothetical protein n=1 Tax=uncultured Bradyrhizobium sp. TaxID=199684 RepID=UPI0035CACFA1
MKNILPICVLALSVAGCGTILDPAQITNASAKSLITGFDAQKTNELKLVAELQAENESLKFISKAKYSCGDPRLLSGLTQGDPAKIVARDKIDKHFTAARKFVDGYLKALSDIASQNKSEQDTIAALAAMSSAVSSIGAPAGSSAGINAAIGALKTLVQFGINDFNVGQMKYIALQMEPGLEGAVATLKKLYPAFSIHEQRLFRDWDECAIEKLVFIRDLPNREVKGYEQFSYIFNKDAGLELDSAYNAYLVKRSQLKSTPLTDALFDKVVLENKKLITLDVSIASLNAGAQNLNTLKTDFQAAVTAVQPLVTTTEASPKNKP